MHVEASYVPFGGAFIMLAMMAWCVKNGESRGFRWKNRLCGCQIPRWVMPTLLVNLATRAGNKKSPGQDARALIQRRLILNLLR